MCVRVCVWVRGVGEVGEARPGVDAGTSGEPAWCSGWTRGWGVTGTGLRFEATAPQLAGLTEVEQN